VLQRMVFLMIFLICSVLPASCVDNRTGKEIEVVKCACQEDNGEEKSFLIINLARKDEASRWKSTRVEIFEKTGPEGLLDDLPRCCGDKHKGLEVSLPLAPDWVRVEFCLNPGKYVLRLGYLPQDGSNPAYLSPSARVLTQEGLELDLIIL